MATNLRPAAVGAGVGVGVSASLVFAQRQGIITQDMETRLAGAAALASGVGIGAILADRLGWLNLNSRMETRTLGFVFGTVGLGLLFGGGQALLNPPAGTASIRMVHPARQLL